MLAWDTARAMSERRWDDDGPGRDSGLATRTRPDTKKPSLYRVLLLNDDYTPMEFVVFVLEQFFNKSRDEATEIMLHVHRPLRRVHFRSGRDQSGSSFGYRAAG